jgi:hypothetical protein
MTSQVFSVGQRVVHTGKPEWGAGTIRSATKTTQDGKPCQLLDIRFDRAGSKTISTAFATLVPAESAPALGVPDMSGEAGGFGGSGPRPEKFVPASSDKEAAFAAKLLGAEDATARMTKLPDGATDPFAGPVARLRFTLGLYRFKPEGGSLLDWAAMQSGLSDPLSKFNRHELERFFEAFVVVRDAHLRKVLGEARKADPAGTARAVGEAPAPVQQLVRRLDAGR